MILRLLRMTLKNFFEAELVIDRRPFCDDNDKLDGIMLNNFLLFFPSSSILSGNLTKEGEVSEPKISLPAATNRCWYRYWKNGKQ